MAATIWFVLVDDLDQLFGGPAPQLLIFLNSSECLLFILQGSNKTLISNKSIEAVSIPCLALMTVTNIGKSFLTNMSYMHRSWSAALAASRKFCKIPISSLPIILFHLLFNHHLKFINSHVLFNWFSSCYRHFTLLCRREKVFYKINNWNRLDSMKQYLLV